MNDTTAQRQHMGTSDTQRKDQTMNAQPIGIPTRHEAISNWQQVITDCDQAIAAGGNGDMSVSLAQTIRRLATATLRNAFDTEPLRQDTDSPSH